MLGAAWEVRNTSGGAPARRLACDEFRIMLKKRYLTIRLARPCQAPAAPSIFAILVPHRRSRTSGQPIMIGLILSLLNLFFFFFPPIEVAPALAPYRLQFIILFPGVAISLVAMSMRPFDIQKPQVWLMIGLWFSVCMSLLSKLQLRATLYSFVDFIVVVSMFIMIAANVNSARRIRVVCGTLALFALTLAIMGICAYHFQYLGDKLVWTHLAEGPVLVTRIMSFGTLNDPNDFAQFLLVGIAMIGVFWRKGRTPANLILLGPPALILIYAIYLTGSRGAMFGIAMIVFVVLSRRIGPIQSVALSATMVLVLIAGHFGGGRSISMQEERITAWGTGISLLKTHPLFGAGFNHFTEKSDITAHNSFVLCFAELGFVGYFFWLGLIIVTVMYFQRMLKIPDENEEDAKAARLVQPLRAAVFSYLVTAWFLSRTYSPVLYVLIALAGALVEVRRKSNPQFASMPLRWVPKTVALQFASVALVYLTIRVRAF